jgi:hypothetical protein
MHKPRDLYSPLTLAPYGDYPQSHPTHNQSASTSYLPKRWKNVNASIFSIIVMSDISKGTNVKNINYFKWMYLHMTTQRTFLFEDTLEPTLEDTTPPWKMKPPCKLLARNPKFLSMPYQVSQHPKP